MEPKLVRGLGFIDSTSIVIGTIIGTGIFLKTPIMAQTVGSPFYVLLAWLVAGLLSCAGALAYAELGGMFHQTGGEYIYLKEAYGRLPSFLYGWQRFWIGSPGTIAAYSVGAATFLGATFSLEFIGGKTGLAISFIIFFSLLNCLAITFGGKVQSFLTFLKIFLIVAIIFGIFFASQSADWLHLNAPAGGGRWPGFSAFGVAMLAALWAYDGWNNLPMVSGEIKNPQRNIPLSLIIGIFSILLIYMMANLVYFYALPFAEVLSANSTAYPDALPVATSAAQTFLGPVGITVLSVVFAISALGAMNGSILTSARVPFAMAEDSLFPQKLSNVNSKTRVPVLAVLVQGVWSCLLAMSGTFDQLTDYVVFASWIFYAAATGAIILFRRRLPNIPRPYKTLGYPWVPVIFMIASVFLLINTLYTSPQQSGIGLMIILAGLPVYFYFHRSRSK
ncbi:MAG: amino acid permease [Deltaproteobacteria bacterium]|nr:amino acid permease [Deltaproteobacteria bacterium]MBI2341573.1 amino acid permease [Deltaproteobacteria bacterium]